MNESKIKYIFEIAYNCPFILLVLLTSLFALPLFNRIEGQNYDNNTTVFGATNTDEYEEIEGQDGLEKIVNLLKNGQKSDNDKAANPEETFREDTTEKENEGTRKEDVNDTETENKQNNKTSVLKNTEKQPQVEKHATEFVEYMPIETNSRYYSDAGKIALTTTYEYVLENDSYFNDAAFLGDSRTLGISDYAGLEGADFFCDNGMTIYKLLEDTGVTWQRTGEKVDMKEVLQEKRYGKIYIMLGMNELGYGDTPMYLKQYLKVLRQIKEWQPEAIIYVMANLHVSREKNDMETEFNNININDKNVAAARLANGRDIFYLDCNPLFTDEEGYLQAELTFDGVHLYAQHYDKWRDFLMEHGVERKDIAESGDGGGKEKTAESADGAGNEDAAKSENNSGTNEAAEHAVSPGEG